MYYATRCPSPVGPLTLLSDGERIAGLWLEGQKYFGASLLANASYEDNAVLREARAWLNHYFAGDRPTLTLPLAPVGSAFRQSVWALLQEIPYGETTTYGALARALAARIGQPSASARAVGGAVGHNPISILIPCHRVIGADGSLTGYAGGVEAKRYLLALEGAGRGR